VETATRRAERPALLFGVALAWAVATWACVALVTDVDDDTAALWIGVVLTLAGPPVLVLPVAWTLFGGPAGRTAGLLGGVGGTLLLIAFIALAGAGAFLYPFHTDDSRAPTLGALAAPWYIVGVVTALAGLVVLGAAVVARLRR
jgi:hypothetical protein